MSKPEQAIVVKKEPGVVWLDETRFNFENGKLTSVGGI
ncbi:Imm58 family immunity protein [Massilia sp. BJB1822]